MKHFLFCIFAAAMASPMLVSCSNDDDGPNNVIYSTIVNFDDNVGNSCVFKYQVLNDSPEIILTANGYTIDTNALHNGARVMITYTYVNKDNVGKTGSIYLAGIQRIFTDTVTTAAIIPAEFSEPYKTVSIQRTGEWINIYSEAGYVPTIFDRKYTIVADESTLNDDFPQLYLSTKVGEDITPGVNSRNFVSVSIKPVWNLSTCQGVDVHVYPDKSLTETVYRFSKDGKTE